jgi:hypothetical protein
MKNLYKNMDIFRCIHESHRGFKNKISVYHILKEKACYPQGCIYFRWKCKQLNKKKSCHRGYSHVGRKCFGCRDFYEEKIHNYPELQIPPEKYKEFRRELEDFEDWLEEYRYKSVDFSGEVAAVKPHFINKVYPKTSFLSFRGFIVVLKDVFLDRIHFEDPVYLLITNNYFRRLALGTNARIEGSGNIHIDLGRLTLQKVRRVEILEKGESAYWNEESIQLARETATEFPEQPEGCVQCSMGALVDVEYNRDHHSSSGRKLFCLKGISDYRDCYVRADYCGLDREANAAPTNKCLDYRGVVIP